MHPRAHKLLEDIRDCAAFIRIATANKSIDDYRGDRMLRQAVERNFEIIGEALTRLAKVDAETATRIDHAREVIAFRNVLAHGYDLVDEATVWETIRNDVPKLIERVTGLLADSSG